MGSMNKPAELLQTFNSCWYQRAIPYPPASSLLQSLHLVYNHHTRQAEDRTEEPQILLKSPRLCWVQSSYPLKNGSRTELRAPEKHWAFTKWKEGWREIWKDKVEFKHKVNSWTTPIVNSWAIFVSEYGKLQPKRRQEKRNKKTKNKWGEQIPRWQIKPKHIIN